MRNRNLGDLFEKFSAAQCTPKEEAAIKAWLHQYNMEGGTGLSFEDFLNAKVNMLTNIDSVRFAVSKRRSLWYKVGLVAAVATIVISAGILFIKHANIEKAAVGVPGNKGATLTLPNGTLIKLSDKVGDELPKEAGINKLSTTNGQTYRVRLPDGSLVWLNSASTLTYQANLDKNGKRLVGLEGEAYFEVIKDKSHPFIVKSNGQEIEVLGTHFNVKAYRDEKSIKTTLVEGSVKVSTAKHAVLLRPGQQSEVFSGKINTEEVDPKDEISWKDGYLTFHNESLECMMNKISRWYNVPVIYRNDNMTPPTEEPIFAGEVLSSIELRRLLELVNHTGIVNLKLENNQIIVSRNGGSIKVK